MLNSIWRWRWSIFNKREQSFITKKSLLFIIIRNKSISCFLNVCVGAYKVLFVISLFLYINDTIWENNFFVIILWIFLKTLDFYSLWINHQLIVLSRKCTLLLHHCTSVIYELINVSYLKISLLDIHISYIVLWDSYWSLQYYELIDIQEKSLLKQLFINVLFSFLNYD